MELPSNGDGAPVGSGSCQCARLSRLFMHMEGIWEGAVGVGGAVSGGVGLCRMWVNDMARRKFLNRRFRPDGFGKSVGFKVGLSPISEVRRRGNWAIRADLSTSFASRAKGERPTGASFSDSPVQ
jgi:hypothetical protein